ncbi:MAG: hypothetical protein P8009_09500 [Gammaproteobacteria bacterium]
MLDLRSLLLGTALTIAVPVVWADTLNMPAQPPTDHQSGQQSGQSMDQEQTAPADQAPNTRAPNQELSVKMPVRGMTMTQVEKQFGIPRNKLPPVGDPPITRWVYKDYTVYFEYKYVIHAVLNAIPVKP